MDVPQRPGRGRDLSGARIAVVGALGWTVVELPGEVGTWIAVAGGLLAVVTTAAVAGPTHGRLTSATALDRTTLLHRLDLADRTRSAGAGLLGGALALVA